MDHNVNIDLVRDRLTLHSGSRMTRSHMLLLQPLFRSIETDSYKFASCHSVVGRRDVLRAISMALQPVKDVVFISRSDPFGKLDWMGSEVFRGSMSEPPGGLDRVNEKVFYASLKDRQYTPFWNDDYNDIRCLIKPSIGTSAGTILHKRFSDMLGKPTVRGLQTKPFGGIWPGLMSSLSNSLQCKAPPLSVLSDPEDSLWTIPFYYIGAVLQNSRELAELLAPLVHFTLRGALPLGESRDDPGTYLLLAD